jgi:hypothetical protein
MMCIVDILYVVLVFAILISFHLTHLFYVDILTVTFLFNIFATMEAYNSAHFVWLY